MFIHMYIIFVYRDKLYITTLLLFFILSEAFVCWNTKTFKFMNRILSRIYFMMHSFSQKVVWMLPQPCNAIWNWNLQDAFVNFLSLYNFQLLYSLSSLRRREVSIFDALSSFSIFSIRKIHFVLSPTSEIFQ